MASVCGRVANRGIKSAVRVVNGNGIGFSLLHRNAKPPSPIPSSSSSSSFSFSAAAAPRPLRSRRFSFSRCPIELGTVESLMPLHSAVAAARMTACLSTSSLTCRSLFQVNKNKPDKVAAPLPQMELMVRETMGAVSYMESLGCQFQGRLCKQAVTMKRG